MGIDESLQILTLALELISISNHPEALDPLLPTSIIRIDVLQVPSCSSNLLVFAKKAVKDMQG